MNLPEVNRTYGYLTVMEVYTKKDSNDDRKYCTVECICGNVKEMRAYVVVNLKAKSCGCVSNKKSVHNIIEDKFNTTPYTKVLSLRAKELLSMCSDNWVYPDMPDSLCAKKITEMFNRTDEFLTYK